jgi:hypothetical protein
MFAAAKFQMWALPTLPTALAPAAHTADLTSGLALNYR